MSQAMFAGVAASELTVGERIAAAVTDAGLSPTEVARQLAGQGAGSVAVASTRRLLHKWMRDDHVPSRDYVRRLSLILDKPETYFALTAPPTPSPITPEAEK